MYSKSEIKERFNNGVVIDRTGVEMPNVHANNVAEFSLVRTLHYRLLDGMPLTKVNRDLVAAGYSAYEIKVILEETNTFLKDVLGIDIAVHRSSLQSTEHLCGAQLIRIFNEIRVKREIEEQAVISYKGKIYDADTKSIRALQSQMHLNEPMAYWVDADNERIAEFEIEDVSGLLTAIGSRSRDIVNKYTDMKTLARELNDAGDLHKLTTFVI